MKWNSHGWLRGASRPSLRLVIVTLFGVTVSLSPGPWLVSAPSQYQLLPYSSILHCPHALQVKNVTDLCPLRNISVIAFSVIAVMYPTQFPRDFRTLSSLDEQLELVTNQIHGGRALGEICSMLGRVFYHKSSINQTYSIIVAEVSEDPLGMHVYELVTMVFVMVSTGPLSIPAN